MPVLGSRFSPKIWVRCSNAAPDSTYTTGAFFSRIGRKTGSTLISISILGVTNAIKVTEKGSIYFNFM